MTNKDEALKMAIEALDTLMMEKGSIYYQAINACKEALEQPTVAELNNEYLRDTNVIGLEQPVQEPVEVYGILDDGDYISVEVTKEGAIKICEDMNKHDWNCTYKPLYTHPHQWQRLTDTEIASIWMHEAVPMNGQDFKKVYRAIEQVLKEKNHVN